jgi:hypothetical protein
MNSPQADTSAASASSANAVPSSDAAKGSSSIAFSSKHHFVVHTTFEDQTTGASVAKPAVGFNDLIVRFAHGDDLTPPSKDAEVTVSYFHVSKTHPPAPFSGTCTLGSDGSFSCAALNFLKPGRWEIHVELKDGSMQDEYVLSFRV